MPLCTLPAHCVPRRGVSAGCVCSSAQGCERKPLKPSTGRIGAGNASASCAFGRIKWKLRVSCVFKSPIDVLGERTDSLVSKSHS